MPEPDDIALLKQYADEHSESAFAELVARYVNLVYSAALRSAGNAHAAQEITQAVFIILAGKANELPQHTVLSGWLYQAARLTAANYLRTEIRRQHREQEAYMQPILNEPESEAWRQISPLLDDAMGRLGEKDRNAIVLRFFENKNLSEVGLALGASEDAAKMRVDRALEKLRRYFNQHGISSTTAIFAGAISANSVQAAPMALAKSVTAVAVAKGAAASTSTLTLIKGALKIMAWTKMKTAIVSGVVVLLTAGTTTLVVEKIATPTIDEALWKPDFDNFKKAPSVALVRRAKPGESYGSVMGPPNGMRIIARSAAPDFLFAFAYGFVETRTILPKELAAEHLDVLLTLPDRQQEGLQRALRKNLGYVGKPRIVETDVLWLKIRSPAALRLTITTDATPVKLSPNGDRVVLKNRSMANLAATLEQRFEKPVLDRTELTNRYDLNMPNLLRKTKDGYGVSNETARPELQQMLEETGLELVPSREPIEMLVVEKVKN
jgi:RNA polymerase sigma factor (sigma-70 family)